MAPSKKQTKKSSIQNKKENFLLSEKSPFAVQESYKTLRTNIIFSLPDSGCKVIIITSGEAGEGKSTTAVNLSIAFAQNHSKVLLVDCDLRKPSDADKLGTASRPGLSDLLVGLIDLNDAVRHLSTGMDFIPAGMIPPNPTELLGSDHMNNLLENLGKYYEYIILDTPPINTMSDAAILSKYAAGVVLVARQNHATRESIREAVNKLEFANAKILGFAFNGLANEKMSGYKRYGKYGYESYGYGQQTNSRSRAKERK